MVRVLFALLVVACTDPPTAADQTTNQVAAYRIQQRQIEIAANRYEMAIATATTELCISMHRAYDRDVRDKLFQISTLDMSLDATITAHGGGAAADLACTTAALTAELDYHRAVACQATALEDNAAEAARHLVALGTSLDHAVARLGEISTGLASESETWTWSLPSSCP